MTAMDDTFSSAAAFNQNTHGFDTGVKAVDVLVESLRIAEHAGRDRHGAGVGNGYEDKE